MTLKNILLVALTIFLGTGLLACGDDKDKASGQAEMKAPASSTSPKPSMGSQKTGSEMVSETMKEDTMAKGIEDNGVIYQDEIYKNWPYQ